MEETAPKNMASLPERLPSSRHLLEFMNSMPVTGDIVEWIYGFREALKRLLGPGSVHRISININFNYGNPNSNPTKAAKMYAVSYCINGQLPIELFSYASDIEKYVQEKPAKLLDQMQKVGFPLDEYQPPLCFNYYDQNYLGSIFLFRYRSPQPIPDWAVEIMYKLHPFIFFALSGAVARRVSADPSQPAFTNFLDKQDMALGLSEKERLVFMLELLGHPRTEIAKRLDISLHSIHKYVQSINRKAGTNRLLEIIVRQIAPDFEEKVMDEIRASGKTKEGRKKNVGLVEWLHEEDTHEVNTSMTIF